MGISQIQKPRPLCHELPWAAHKRTGSRGGRGRIGVMVGVSGTLDAPVAADRRSDSVPYPEGPKSPAPIGRAGPCHRTLRQATDRCSNRDLQKDRVGNCRRGQFGAYPALDVSHIRLLSLILGDFPFSWRCRATRILGNVGLDVHPWIMWSSNCAAVCRRDDSLCFT